MSIPYAIKQALRRADLNRADLRGADLRGTDLRGADLRGACFENAGKRYVYESGTHLKEIK